MHNDCSEVVDNALALERVHFARRSEPVFKGDALSQLAAQLECRRVLKPLEMEDQNRRERLDFDPFVALSV